MSKGKKSTENILESALVPEEEQPYEVPENWVWVKFDRIIKTSSNRANAIKQKDYEETGRIPVVDQGMQLISGFTNNQENKYTGELPVIVFGDHTRCIKWIDFDFAQGADGTKLLKPIEKLYPKYFYYLFKIVNLPNKGYSRHFKYLRETLLPLPPTNEQKRIADKVECLLNKIKDAGQLIKEAKETFELRQASILDKAFRGELTTKWRKENVTGLEGWETVAFDDVAIAIDPQPSHRTPAINDDGVPYIGIKDCNYETREIDFINARPVSKSVLDEHVNRYIINEGDFIIGKIGTIGKPFNIPTKRNYVLSANVILIQPKTEKVNPRYLYYLFQSSHIEKQLNAGMNSTTQAAFGIKKVRTLNVNICSLSEQKKIVQILDNIFENESRAKELNKKIHQFDNLKKSILQIAFQGELGTNDPSEESAIELLKDVLIEKQ
jgi:type I restriction enzyme, S subunit